jgi:protein phosphatase
MQQDLDADALSALSKDQLVISLLKAREEINELKAQVISLQRTSLGTTLSPSLSPTPAGVVRGPGARPVQDAYTVSLNVLNITGNARQRICRTVPLQMILTRADTRPDEREADTPVATGGTSHPRFSVSMGRFSGFSFGSEGGLQLPDDYSPGRMTEGRPSDGGRLSLAQSPEVSPPPSLGGEGRQSSFMTTATGPTTTGKSNKNRPAPLLHVAGPLDSNAILSQNTLHAFRHLQVNAPLSPQPGQATHVMHYIMDVFAKKNNFSHEDDPTYVEGLARTLISLCSEVERIVKEEPAHPTVTSPAYVFGDIHGNFKDLHYFCTQLINFDDLRFAPYRFVFLGDYVDRGDFSVECVAFLFALKALAPHKVTLLRGNHEDTLVNGDRNLYRDTSYKAQCHAVFGELLGERVWTRTNDVFSHLPLTANIDNRIFCTHGGLPRYAGGPDHRMENLRKKIPPMRSFFEIPANETPESRAVRQSATDVCWSDPAEDERRMDRFGFGQNPRGNGVIMFGGTAVDQFLNEYGFEYIFRAHQEKSDGLKISKNARVITIFSTSAYVGHQNGAGVVYVGDNRIRLIVKEPDTPSDDDEVYMT